MSFGKGNSSTTLDEIYKAVSEFQILAYYLNINQIPCVISSPLRKDTNPSFALYSKNGIKIQYLDYGTRESGGTIDLLSALWGTNYNDTVSRLAEDLPKFAQVQNNPLIVKKEQHDSGKHIYSIETDLQCKVREWKEYDLVYWKNAGISLPWLKFGKVFPISHIIVIKRGNRYIIPADKYAYVYVEFKDGNPSLKFYQPFSKSHKWSNKHDASVWDLWEQLLKTGERLIITSSRKDALSVWENTGIPSCSLQAESYHPKPHVMQQLKERFKYIYVLYDNDFKSTVNYGRAYGASLAEEFGLTQIEIPDEYQSKDPSDLCNNYNREKLKEVILSLINEKEKILNNQ